MNDRELPTLEDLGPKEQYTKEIVLDLNRGDMVITVVVGWANKYVGFGIREFHYVFKGGAPVERMSEIVGYAMDMLQASGLDQLITDLHNIYDVHPPQAQGLRQDSGW